MIAQTIKWRLAGATGIPTFSTKSIYPFFKLLINEHELGTEVFFLNEALIIGCMEHPFVLDERHSEQGYITKIWFYQLIKVKLSP